MCKLGRMTGLAPIRSTLLSRNFPGGFEGWSFEPLQDKFELLKRTYADVESVIPVNVAIHNTEKEMLIHRVRPDKEKICRRGLEESGPSTPNTINFHNWIVPT